MLKLTTEAIDPARLLAAVASPHAGGTTLFVGTVRDLTGPEVTAALDYEAYAPMAEGVFAEIAAEVRAGFTVLGVAIVHRTGRLGVGEISVAVACSCPHRADSFAAARYAIDAVKSRAPVWKRDIPPAGGAETWVHPGPGS